jgi:hypothetical protein
VPCQNIEVIMPEPDPPEVQETVGSDPVASASSSAADSSSLAEKAIATMDPELAAQANDPKRKARSQDLGWKFRWWPDTRKDFVQCIFCMKVVPSVIKRFKHHLVGGFGDTTKCARVPELVSKEMHAYLRKNTKFVINLDPEEGEDRNEAAPQPSANKQRKKLRLQ